MKVPVFSFPWKCYKCAEEMKVTYPTTEYVYKTEFRGNLAPFLVFLNSIAPSFSVRLHLELENVH